MPSKHSTRRRASSLDTDSREMLYDGANLSQLSIIFRMDHRVLVEKLHDCPATGQRNGTETWRIDMAAPYLVKPVGDIEAYLRRMNPADLPKALSREFWTAIKTRQEVEKASGDLWPTERVIGVIGSLMKLMKMSVRLMCDSVDTKAELSDTQRRIVKNLGDSMLERLYADVRDNFKPKKEGERELPVPDEVVVMSERLVEVLQLDDDEFDRLMRAAKGDDDEL